jgi:photosystem II stability/assembly factor-like uncharacterized protein
VTDDDELEARVRAYGSRWRDAHAFSADVDTARLARRSRSKVVAAVLAAVAVVAGAIGVAAALRQGDSPKPHIVTPSSTPSSANRASTTRPSPQGPSTSTPTTTNPRLVRPLTPGVESWTWVSDDHGFALVRTACGTEVCVGVRETVDGGHTWTSLAAPAALDWRAQSDPDTACVNRPCLSSIRFANPQIGWLFGPALFHTGDGGHTWTRVPSPTVADLEIANGVAMRITTADRDCGGGCAFHVDRQRVGTSTWERLAATVYGFPQLILQGRDSYAIGIPNFAGAGETVLEHSSDEGTTWVPIPDPCPGPPQGFRTAAASAAPDGALVVLCVSVDEASASIRVSTDHGKTFGPRRTVSPGIPRAAFVPITAGSSDTIAIAYSDQQHYGVVVTNDGGRTWRTTLDHATAATAVANFSPSIGFEDTTTARVSFNTASIWTTRNSGRTWTPDTVTPPAVPPCRVGQLSAAGGWQGATGSMAGVIWITNTGTTPCSLSGRPSIRLLDDRGQQLDVQASDSQDGLSPASVTLLPGIERGAQFTVVWRNWCGNATPLTVQVVLPQSQELLRVADQGFSSRPRCDQRSAGSAISIGQFEAPPS